MSEKSRTLKTILDDHLGSYTYAVASLKFNKNNLALVINLKAKKQIPLEVLKALENEVLGAQDKATKVIAEICYDGLKLNESELESYRKVLIDSIKGVDPSMGAIMKQSTFSVSGSVVDLTFYDETFKNHFEKIGGVKHYEQLLYKTWKENYSVNVKLEHDATGEQQFLNEQKEIIKTHMKVESTQVKEKPQKKEKPTINGKQYGNKSKKSDEIYRRKITREIMPIEELVQENELVAIEGKVFMTDHRELRGGKILFNFTVTDYTNAITCKMFLKPAEFDELSEKIVKGSWYFIEGNVRYDQFDREMAVYPLNINASFRVEKKREDNAEEKRVELHMHTNMSEMDALVPIKKLVARAKEWGHKAVAITDHGVLQAFPDAPGVAGDDIKVLYGVEGYLINDSIEVIKQERGQDLNGSFVVFDLETTGFSFKNDGITEIGACKVENGNIVDTFSTFVNPGKPIPDKVIEITGITDDMVKDAPKIEEVLPKFLDFIGDSVYVAHNADFDISFIREACKRSNISFDPTVADTLTMSRLLLTKLKRHKLGTVAKRLKVKLENAHRAVDDAKATSEIFIKFRAMLKDKDLLTLKEVNDYAAETMDYTAQSAYHVIIFAKNREGLRSLYELVSESNTKYFYRTPRIPKSLLARNRENLVIGSACEAGELFRGMMSNKTEDELDKIVEFYDYIEVQPHMNNYFMVRNGNAQDEQELIELNKRLIELGKKHDKLVVATGDVHFMDPEDAIYRSILTANKFSDADNQPPLYFKTTEEMLDDFSYLSDELAKEIVITNPNKIADMMDDILPVPKGTFPPIIDGADEEFRTMCYAKAKRIYGDPLPEIVKERLTTELNSIISNGYAVMYIIAQKLVTKSLEDGYLVGSRGSVGSSFAATMSDITEVNPLPPHYVCGECKYSHFFVEGEYGSGADLPEELCPNCGIPLIRDGHEIPFATFLGFDGDKEPDIDLNFAGVYQSTSHKYTEELFGEGKTFKAGTIGTIAEKTAFGYVKNYFEERGRKISTKEVLRLAEGITGVKRTSGQHPGGIMVVPRDRNINEFCPIQFPANDAKSGVVTTHFDYHSISGRLLKLDILGHDVPTIIKQLEGLTGRNVFDIPLADPETVKIFTSVESLNIVDEDYKLDIGSLGIPEFGTKFVRQMLKDTQPSTFSDLVRISGLSHGTDVWLNNAQDLVRDNVVTIAEVISTRDDIMNYLILQGLDPLKSFKLMEQVRKGKGLKDEDIAYMKEFKVPDWYIKSCQTIKYMFPKAHAVAYVMMSMRIAYFKVHEPLAFYATYFSTKVDDFDAHLITKGKESVKRKMKEIEEMENPSKKEQDLYTTLELAYEMYARGLGFNKVDLYKSESDQFTIVDGKLLPPFRALQGCGESAARSIVVARDDGEFLSIDDVRSRAKVTKTVVEALFEHGCLEGMPESNQLSIFSFSN